MAVLYFSGDQVAFYGGISGDGTSTTFSSVDAPFLSTDLVEIEIPDIYIDANGEFDPNIVQFTSVTVVRDGVRYDFDVNTGSTIKESGGGSNTEQGDSFFITNDSVGPPASGPFSGLDSGNMVFSLVETFTTGVDTTIQRSTDLDLNEDGDTNDTAESGDGNFNVSLSLSPPCIAPDTLILTPGGERRIDELRAGDLVTLADGGRSAILWKGTRKRQFGSSHHPHKPIRIKAGSMGRDRPNADLVVSPQHRILLTIPQSGNIFDPGEVLAPAKALIQRRGVQHMRSIRQIEYHTVLLDRHALIIANGLTVESYYPAAYALSTLTQGQRNQIDALFPGVQQDVLAAYGPKVRRVLKTREVRALIKLGHGMPLQSGERTRLRLSAA